MQHSFIQLAIFLGTGTLFSLSTNDKENICFIESVGEKAVLSGGPANHRKLY